MVPCLHPWVGSGPPDLLGSWGEKLLMTQSNQVVEVVLRVIMVTFQAEDRRVFSTHAETLSLLVLHPDPHLSFICTSVCLEGNFIIFNNVFIYLQLMSWRFPLWLCIYLTCHSQKIYSWGLNVYNSCFFSASLSPWLMKTTCCCDFTGGGKVIHPVRFQLGCITMNFFSLISLESELKPTALWPFLFKTFQIKNKNNIYLFISLFLQVFLSFAFGIGF